MNASEAYAMLPAGAQWSSSFGYPGEGGYTEYHRTPDGQLWQITNGSHDLPSFALDWQCKQLEPKPVCNH
jgi:hypothetical protein